MATKSRLPMTPHIDSKAAMKTQAYSMVELVDDKAHSNDLVFTQNGRKVVVKPSMVEQIFEKSSLQAKTTKISAEDLLSSLTTQLIGQYGMKSSKDVMDFLKSPAGKMTQNLINAQLLALAELQDELHQQQLDTQMRQLRIKAFLLLTALERKNAHAKQLNDYIRQQIDEMLDKGRRAANSQVKSKSSFDELMYLEQIDMAYGLSAQLIESALEKKLEESQKLEDEMATLEKQGEEISKRYGTFETHLKSLDKHYETIENKESSMEDKIKHVEGLIADIMKNAEVQRDEIDRLIATNQDLEAKELLHELNGLNAVAAGLDDLINVLSNKKALYNAEGEVSTFDKADFILSNEKGKEQKIVKHEGKFYLLNKNQDFSLMGIEQKIKAQQSYEMAKPNITSLKNLVQHNKGMETTLHHGKKQDVNARSEAMQKDILALTNQLNLVQAARANTAALIGLGTDTILPTPTPTLNPTVSTLEKPTQFSTASSYRHVLALMKNNPTQEAIDRFKKGFVQVNGQPNQAAQREIANTIRPGQPISQATMNSLLRNLERLGISANKPSVTATPSPLEQALKPKTPTPFPTKPPY